MAPDRSRPLHITALGDSAQPAILFLHGFLGRGDDWTEIAADLSDHHCLLVDLPGHGRSVTCPQELYPMPACAEAIVAELDYRKIDRAALCAYSMGGRLAFYLLTHFPDRFTRALIESSTAGLRTEIERGDRRAHNESLAQRLEHDGIGPFLVFWYRQPLFASLASDQQRLKKLVNGRLDNDPAAMARSLREMGTGRMPNLWPELSQITHPLYLVTGEADEKFCAIAREIVDLCPSAEHHILRGCGHTVHVEASAAFSELAVQFFS